MNKDRISKQEMSDFMRRLAKLKHKKNPVDPKFMSKIGKIGAANRRKKLSTDSA